MNNRLNFTKRVLQELPLPESGKRSYFYDTRINGLVLQVTSTGAKSFQVYRKLHNKPVRVTLGKFPDLTIAQARTKAQDALSQLAHGINPTAEKRADDARAITLGEVFADYLESRDLKPYTVKDYNRVMHHDLADWQDKPIISITKDMVERRHDQLGKASKARSNNAMRVLRAVINFAIGKYDNTDGTPIISFNPVSRLSTTRAWYRVDNRRSVIKPHQLAPWFKAVLSLEAERATGKADIVKDYMLFILFTGLRREEAARLEWSEVDMKGRSFIVLDPKNRVPHELPLSDYLFDLLERRKADAEDSSFVFPGDGSTGHIVEPRRWMEKVTKQSSVEFTLHDLRRTFVTVAESLDIPAYALKRLLNHKSGNSDVTAGYVVIDTERLREPMQRITDFILKAAEIKPTANVLPISKTK